MKYFVLILALLSCSANALNMHNTLTFTGEGQPNPLYNQRIKNLIIYHPTGAAWWYDQEPNNPNWTSTWPLDGGKGPSDYTGPHNKGYLFRDHAYFLNQMEHFKNLGHTAVAAFMIPNNEAGLIPREGYGAYWTPTGEWKKPADYYDTVKWAAWMKGVHVAPFISLNDYREKGSKEILPALKRMVDFAMHRFDGVSLKTDDGRAVILIEGLPWRTNLSAAQKTEIHKYLASRTDIVWIDNLALACPTYAPNIYSSAAVSDMSGTIQENFKNNCGGRYLWHFVNKTAATNPGALQFIPFDIQKRWLNITPHDADMYPVIHSQWNEYTEWLIYEPNQYWGNNEYDYIKWRISQQP